jgi:uncharacterized alkaline shock family protein YloU
MSEYRSDGTTTMTPDVLLTIARMAALEVEGVSRMAQVRGGVNNLFKKGNEGVRIALEDNNAFIDLFLVLKNDVHIRDVSRKVQQEVSRAIAEITGLQVGNVNIHIEDIDFKNGA